MLNHSKLNGGCFRITTKITNSCSTNKHDDAKRNNFKCLQ
jgi:hypothetical protein